MASFSSIRQTFIPATLAFIVITSTARAQPSTAVAPVVPVGAAHVRVGEPVKAPPAFLATALPQPQGTGASGCRGSWHNAGGTPARGGRSDEIGPTTADLLWSGGRFSVIAWQPVTDGNRVFMVRQNSFPPDPPNRPEDAPVVAMDLTTGDELWAAHLPYESGDWTTWIAAANNGLVFASRSGNGATVSAKIYALRQVDGSVAWISADEVTASTYDGVVLAPNGDLLVGDFTRLRRIRASNGTTVWSAARVCSVSDSCGPAIYGDAVYVVDAVPGGHSIIRFNLATGAQQYASPVMSGFTAQNTPYVGPDGTIYFARTQNNAATDFLYAFEDTGSALVERWHVPVAWTTYSELAVGLDGSPYIFAPGYELVRLDPATGVETATAGTFPGLDYAPRMAIDGNGTLYLGNGEFADGRLLVFDSDLNPLWDVPVDSINIGGPAIGSNGALVVAGIGSDVRVYRPDPVVSVCTVFIDGFESGNTAAWSATIP